MPRANAWCFTENNPPDIDMPKQWSEMADYIVYQYEKGKEGTPHLQGYVYFHVRKTFDFVKNLAPRLSWRSANGSAEQNKPYCTKCCDDYKDPHHTCLHQRIAGPWEIGLMPKNTGQGTRSDLKRLYSAIEGGASRRSLFKDHTSCSYKYSHAISLHMSLVKPKPPVRHAVEVHIGKTGTGKTRYVNDTYPDHWATPIRQGKMMWFDGYDGHSVILLDDFNGEMALKALLRLLDRYVIQVPIKGAHAWWRPELLIITTNYEVEKWYDYTDREESLRALQRRITKTVRYPDLPSISTVSTVPAAAPHFSTVAECEPHVVHFPSISDVLS